MSAPKSQTNIANETPLREAIQQQLRNNGVYNEIIASVRSSILLSLQKANPKSPACIKYEGNLENIALLSLIRHYLEQCNFVHTLSVFSAETGLESYRHKVNMIPKILSIDDAIKALGLDDIWNDWKKIKEDENQGGLLMIFRAVSYWCASQREATPVHHSMVATSAQTDIDSSYLLKKDEITIEESLIAIQQECKRQMKEEMNEKLKLSVKKQVIHAAKVQEKKHEQEINLMRNQIDSERLQTKQRVDALIDELSQIKQLMQTERSEMERANQMILREKLALVSEMNLLHEQVKDIQQTRLKEWSVEFDKMSQAHALKMKELEEERRSLQIETNEVSRQRDAIRLKDIDFSSLQNEKEFLLSERKELMEKISQHRQEISSSKHENECLRQSLSKLQSDCLKLRQQYHSMESLLKQDQSHLQFQYRKLEEKYNVISMNFEKNVHELEDAKNESVGLRKLLKQSQTALESVSLSDFEDCRLNAENPYLKSSAIPATCHVNERESTSTRQPTMKLSLSQNSALVRTFSSKDREEKRCTTEQFSSEDREEERSVTEQKYSFGSEIISEAYRTLNKLGCHHSETIDNKEEQLRKRHSFTLEDIPIKAPDPPDSGTSADHIEIESSSHHPAKMAQFIRKAHESSISKTLHPLLKAEINIDMSTISVDSSHDDCDVNNGGLKGVSPRSAKVQLNQVDSINDAQTDLVSSECKHFTPKDGGQEVIHAFLLQPARNPANYEQDETLSHFQAENQHESFTSVSYDTQFDKYSQTFHTDITDVSEHCVLEPGLNHFENLAGINHETDTSGNVENNMENNTVFSSNLEEIIKVPKDSEVMQSGLTAVAKNENVIIIQRVNTSRSTSSSDSTSAYSGCSFFSEEEPS